MYDFSRKSLQALSTLDSRLEKLAKILIHVKDFSVLEGLRSKEKQKEYVKKGVSQTMNSKHLANEKGEAEALDFAPYFRAPPHWRWPGSALEDAENALAVKDFEGVREALKDYGMLCAEWAFLAGLFRGAAEALDIPVRNGMDWDRDGYVVDESFLDWGHVELQEEEE